MHTVSELCHSFWSWCELHRAPATTRQYRQRLRSFAARFGDRQFVDLSPLEVQDYLAHADRWPDGRLKAPDTRRANAVALEQLQAFALRFDVIQKRVFQPLEKPPGRQRDTLPTASDVAAILQHSGPAFQLIYRALRQCGARPGELAKATISDWHRNDGEIVLLDHKTARKTGLPRRIAVGEKLLAILEQATAGRSEGPLFLTDRGGQWTTSLLSRAYYRARQRAGLSRNLVLYLARHEHATQICDRLGIEAAADALGHKSLSTTKRYTRINLERMRANQDAFDPGT